VIERQAGNESTKVTFSVPASEGDVAVVGSFNDWDPSVHRLHHDGSVQSVTVDLPVGSRYEFRYLATDGRWFDEPDADGRDGDNCVLEIAPSGSADSVSDNAARPEALKAEPEATKAPRRKSAKASEAGAPS